MTRAKVISLVVGLLLTLPATAGASKLLRLNGIGPLKLGMKRAAALSTGWLAHMAKGCELLSPRPTTYTLTGPNAPTSVTGLVQFQHRRLMSISMTRGVHTAAGVVLGRTTSSQMVSDYQNAGFTASAAFSRTFGGTFTTVKRNGASVIQGFGAQKIVTLLAIPAAQVCD
jgi:hypothetical protein